MSQSGKSDEEVNEADGSSVAGGWPKALSQSGTSAGAPGSLLVGAPVCCNQSGWDDVSFPCSGSDGVGEEGC